MQDMLGNPDLVQSIFECRKKRSVRNHSWGNRVVKYASIAQWIECHLAELFKSIYVI